jgi:hypothetical protein
MEPFFWQKEYGRTRGLQARGDYLSAGRISICRAERIVHHCRVRYGAPDNFGAWNERTSHPFAEATLKGEIIWYQLFSELGSGSDPAET